MPTTIKSSGIQFNVSSIANLPTTNLEDGLITISNDPTNSGIFYYDSTQSTVNNGVSIINGWIKHTGLIPSSEEILTFSTPQLAYTLTVETSAERALYLGNKRFVVGSEGTAKIYTSDDYGVTWIDRGRIGSTTTETTIFRLANIGNGVVMAGTSPNGKLWRSVNYGTSFTEVNFGGTNKEDLRGIEYVGDGIVLVGTTSNYADTYHSGTIYRSTDYGLTFTQVYDGKDTPELPGIMDIKHLGKGVCLATVCGLSGGSRPYDTRLLRSTNYGLTWSIVGPLIPASSILEIATDKKGYAVMFANYPDAMSINRGVMYYTSDYGLNWQTNGQPIASELLFNGIMFVDDTNMLIGTNPSCKIFKSSDKGMTWSEHANISENGSNITVYCFAKAETGKVIAGTYHYSGVGKIWSMNYTRAI